MRYALTQVDPLELERRAYENLFDLMDQYSKEHPEASDEDCHNAVCFRNFPRQPTDYAQEPRRDR